MTSRTPIRLTHYRGPLATPSTSPESTPTSSTPPIDISYCPTAIRQALDVVILHHRISTLSPPTRHQPRSRLYRRRRGVTKQGPFDCSTNICSLDPAFESLIYSAWDLAQSLAGIVMLCLLIWGLLEWSSYASDVRRQPNSLVSIPRFPLPSPTRALRCHVNPSLCELRDRHVAVVQFLSEQIQHARALSSLTISLGLPLRAFFEAHRITIPRIRVRHNFTELPVDRLANLTEFFDSPLLDFTSGSFIGRSLTLALDELGDLISEPMLSQGSSTHGERQDAHLHAIYWRTTSNLLLEYSAARPRARKFLQQLRALHQQLLPFALGHHTAKNIERRSNIWWWASGLPHPAIPIENGMEAFMTGLEVTLDNVHQLVAYLDWITEQLAQTTLRDVLKIRRKSDFSSCIISLQDLFAQSRPSALKKFCLCPDDYGVTSTRPERIEIMVPGSPTVRTGR